MDPELYLAKAIQRVRQSKTVKQQQTILNSSSADDKNLDKIKVNMEKGKTKTWQQFKKGQKPVKQIDKECGCCGQRNKHSWKDSPAIVIQCRKMSEKGHFAVVCHSSEAAGVREVKENCNDRDREECLFLGEIGTERSEPLVEQVKLNEENIQFKLDTGTDVTSIPETLYKP